MMNPKRRLAGALAKIQGDAFEAWVERHHQAALRLGILTHIAHNGPTAQMINGEWTMVAAGYADYTGTCFNKVGTTVATEAKSYKHRLPKSAISDKQQEHLNAVVLGGGLAFLLARITDEVSQEFCVPWQLVPWKVARTAQSVTAEDLMPWLIPPSCTCYLETYCPVRGVPASGVAGGQQRRFARE